MLRLKDTPVLAMGMNRRIYQHPDNDDWLVKVVRHEHFDERSVFRPGDGRSPWYKSGRRHGIYIGLMRELDQYIAIRARYSELPPCIQRVFNLAETDFGLGLVVEKLRGPDGGLAPTLEMLVARDGFTPELRQEYEDYLALIIRLNIVTSNADEQNLVRATCPIHGSRLVLVDGLGEKTLIPANTHIPLLNRYNTRRRSRRVVRRLEALDAARAGAVS